MVDNSEIVARYSLVILVELFRRGFWRDSCVVNKIAISCFSKSSRLTMPALMFFVGDCIKLKGNQEIGQIYMNINLKRQKQHILHNPIFIVQSEKNANKTFNEVSVHIKVIKRKKLNDKIILKKTNFNKGNLLNSNNTNNAILLLKDPHIFVHKLIRKFQLSHEKFEAKILLLQVICCIIGTQKLIVLNFYQIFQSYVIQQYRLISTIFVVLIQAIHSLVSPDVLAPEILRLMNYFIYDRAGLERIILGLCCIYEICSKQPQIINEDLLKYLTKFRDKKVLIVTCRLLALYNNTTSIMPNKIVYLSKDDFIKQNKINSPPYFKIGNISSKFVKLINKNERIKEQREQINIKDKFFFFNVKNYCCKNGIDINLPDVIEQDCDKNEYLYKLEKFLSKRLRKKKNIRIQKQNKIL